MGLAARFPAHIVQGALFGQALCGVLTSLASLVAQATTPDPTWNGLAYFAASALFTAMSLTMYLTVVKTVSVSEFALANHSDINRTTR